jgi:hypothetical protein
MLHHPSGFSLRITFDSPVCWPRQKTSIESKNLAVSVTYGQEIKRKIKPARVVGGVLPATGALVQGHR